MAMTDQAWIDFDKGVDSMDETDAKIALKYIAREGQKLQDRLDEHDLRKDMLNILGPLVNEHQGIIDSVVKDGQAVTEAS